ncbi:glycosyltransferase family 2 protein [Pedobacter sp. R-06]|uniref:glycosyltransferase family 2 protein n=1 Tax=Pedobacter sp. R-06 TaxID=3404051 RepID=UPI003CF213B4
MDSPLVSVCMPAYNAENYIAEAIESVLKQCYKNLELIIVNDGSTDKTLEVINSFYDQRLTVITIENSGQCSAANKAFYLSKGSLIKFMDADDIISPNFISLQVEKLNGNEDFIASAAWGRFNNNDLSTFKLNPESVWKDMQPIDWLKESLLSGQNMMQCALWLIPRGILTKSKLWDERLSLINDFDFFIRVLLSSNKILFTPNAILYYRSGISNSLSGLKSKKGLESAFLSTKLGTESLLRFENSHIVQKIAANQFQYWKYQFYPTDMELYYKCKKEIKRLGSSKQKMEAGGITKFLNGFLGWKLTKRLKILIEGFYKTKKNTN